MPLDPVLAVQLKAIRAQCEATIWMVTAVLQAQGGEGAPPSQVSQSETESEECTHPMEARRSIAAMGNPGRQICGICRKEVK